MFTSRVKRILIAPGAFKHSLSAGDAARAIERGLRRSGLAAGYERLPIADGGNGTLEAFLAGELGLRRIEVRAHDPLMRPIRAAYAAGGGRTPAVIEMALASGLELLGDGELDALRATTYGTGELLRAALDDAPTGEVIVGLGGSATTDGGAGCLQALGARFFDSAGAELPAGLGGGGLEQVARIDLEALRGRWAGVSVVIATDVDNPTLGDRGAAAVFAPQKGASGAEVARLEAGLRHFFTLLAEQHGVDVRAVPGGGAAGGLAAGLLAAFGDRARIESGIDLILDVSGFDERLARCDLVITGEGRMDAQTISGKGPIGVARRAAAAGVRSVALVGGLAVDDALLHEAGLWAVLPIVTAPMALEEAIRDADALLERAALRLGYLLGVGGD